MCNIRLHLHQWGVGTVWLNFNYKKNTDELKKLVCHENEMKEITKKPTNAVA